MNSLSLKNFAAIIKGKLLTEPEHQQAVTGVSIDSRRIIKNSVFFPLKGNRLDGHMFVEDALNNGAVAVVVRENWLDGQACKDIGALITVDDPLEAMHRLAVWWRTKLNGKIIGITGSNGKTIVKDALIQMLSGVSLCSGSPGSFNSQIGVPLSIIRIPQAVEYAVLEAGVSNVGEMNNLEQMIRPDYGILTNIGQAHIAAFGNRYKIAEEKLKLFENIKSDGWVLIPAGDPRDPVIDKAISRLTCKIYRFGQPSDSLPFIKNSEITKEGIRLSVHFPNGEIIKAPFSTPSQEIISDIDIAICAAYLLGINTETIENALTNYIPGTTRMEIWKSPAGFMLINDSCSSDPISVRAALNTLASIKQDGGKRIFVFGGMKELGDLTIEEHAHVGAMAAESNVDTLVLIGENALTATEDEFKRIAPAKEVLHCKDSDELKDNLLPNLNWGDIVLVKGPRNTGIARVAKDIIEAMAPNRFTIDLQVVYENLKQFQRLVGPKTSILAMVKALAYGSDINKLSLALQHMGVDCFGVATADEGAVLRRAGVDLPIIVMMCTPEEVEKIIRYHLTAMVYSAGIVEPLARVARTQNGILDVHMEVDTGLGRLGVVPEMALELARKIASTGSLHLIGLMTHFACAEDPTKDDFTSFQIHRFKQVIDALKQTGFSGFICHASATAGTIRFPEAWFDMVRVGIGTYGIYPSEDVAEKIDLELAISLMSRIVEVRVLNKGHRIGYGATFEVPRDGFRVGIVPMGFHDGIPWILSNRGSVLVNGKRAPILGRISMDSMIIDLSDIPDAVRMQDVLIYGKHGGYIIRPEEVANTSGTIPYELLTRLGPRVQRIFVGEFN